MIHGDFWQAAAAMFIADFSRYVLGAGIVFLVLWKALRRRVQHRRINPEFPEAQQLRREFLYSMSTVLIFAANGLVVYYFTLNGMFTIYEDIAAYGGWTYWVASLFALVVTHDFYFYWTHRAMHHPALFRWVHAVHHRSRNPSPWAAYSFHPIEALVQALFLPLMLWIMPLHGGVIALFLLHMIARNALGHSGVEIYPRNAVRRFGFRWLTSTTHHHLHHETARGNYGLYFSWWDRGMETQRPEYERVFDEVTNRCPVGNAR